jgi:hypothetical protein
MSALGLLKLSGRFGAMRINSSQQFVPFVAQVHNGSAVKSTAITEKDKTSLALVPLRNASTSGSEGK